MFIAEWGILAEHPQILAAASAKRHDHLALPQASGSTIGDICASDLHRVDEGGGFLRRWGDFTGCWWEISGIHVGKYRGNIWILIGYGMFMGELS